MDHEMHVAALLNVFRAIKVENSRRAAGHPNDLRTASQFLGSL